jgi:hypothetical protein
VRVAQGLRPRSRLQPLALMLFGLLLAWGGVRAASSCLSGGELPCGRLEQSAVFLVLIGGTSLIAVGSFWLFLSLANRR